MEETREDKLTGLRLKKLELESLEEKDASLTIEINELKAEEPVK